MRRGLHILAASWALALGLGACAPETPATGATERLQLKAEALRAMRLRENHEGPLERILLARMVGDWARVEGYRSGPRVPSHIVVLRRSEGVWESVIHLGSQLRYGVPRIKYGELGKKLQRVGAPPELTDRDANWSGGPGGRPLKSKTIGTLAVSYPVGDSLVVIGPDSLLLIGPGKAYQVTLDMIAPTGDPIDDFVLDVIASRRSGPGPRLSELEFTGMGALHGRAFIRTAWSDSGSTLIEFWYDAANGQPIRHVRTNVTTWGLRSGLVGAVWTLLGPL